MKVCRICKIEKEINNFCIRNKRTGNTRNECTDCLNKRKKKWSDDNPEAKKIIQKRYENKKFKNECRFCKCQMISTSQIPICSIKCRLLEGIKKDDKTGCWIWIKSTCGAYGKIRFEGKTDTAHRVSYKIFKGEIPKKVCVCHKCDTPLCVNPDHLFLGTHKENTQDSIRKGRTNHRNENNSFCRLSNKAIEEIRKMKENGYSLRKISEIFGCSITHIWNIVKMRSRNGL